MLAEAALPLVRTTFVFVLLVKNVFLLSHRMRCSDLSPSEHYRINCTEAGLATCAEGWKGLDCKTPMCSKECHSAHGYCKRPGECKCQPGWRGPECAKCVPLPGCKHGYCRRNSYECLCEPGWKGTYCSIPVCRRGCRPSRGYCKIPQECRCRIGWGGSTCEQCETLPGCVNGLCTKPLECLCKEGWTGQYCNKPVCRNNCNANHGSCNKPDECRCKVGWWGAKCDTCFPYPGCTHGTCNEPWECNCEPGWKGLTCNEEDTSGNYCSRTVNPCLNGGTCIDTPGGKNFTCSCPSLFTGRHCDYLVKSSAPFFPIFRKGMVTWRSQSSLNKEDFMNPMSMRRKSVSDGRNISIKSGRDLKTTEGIIPKEKEKIIIDSNDTPLTASGLTSESTGKDFQSQIVMPEIPSSPLFSKGSQFQKKYEPETAETLLETTTQYLMKEAIITEKETANQVIDSIATEAEHFLKKHLETVLENAGSITQRKDKSKSKELDAIILLDLKEKAKEVNETPQRRVDLRNTDPNSAHANQIDERARFLRHQESVGVPPSLPDVNEASPTPFFFKNVRLGVQDTILQPANLRRSHFRINRPANILNSLPAARSTQSKVQSGLPRISQSRINRRTGFISSKKAQASIPRRTFKIYSNGPRRYSAPKTISSESTIQVPIRTHPSQPQSSGGISTAKALTDRKLWTSNDSETIPGLVVPAASHKDLEPPTQASAATEVKETSKEWNTFYDEHYNGRVHIGDVTGVDKHAPLEEIISAFIELKKLKRS